MSKQLLAVFDKELRLVGFIGPMPELTLEVCTWVVPEHISIIEDLLRRIKINGARVMVEYESKKGIDVDIEKVFPSDFNYWMGVAEEFRMAGFSTAFVPLTIKQLLLFIHEKFTQEQREKVTGEIVNLPLDIEPEAVSELESIIKELSLLR